MFHTESVKCYSSLSLRCMWSCNWRMMRFLLLFFLPSSTCFFSTSLTSHYLIGHFQVGFMRAKLISVSKFREQERGWKKRKTWLNGLFWFPLWCQAHNNEIKSLITFKLLDFFFFLTNTECHFLSWHFVWHDHRPGNKASSCPLYKLFPL